MTDLLFHLPKKTGKWFPITYTSISKSTLGATILFLEQGTGKCQLEQQFIEMGEGDLILIAPDKTFILSDLVNTEGWVLNFSIEAISAANLDVRGLSILFIEESLFSPLRSNKQQYKPTEEYLRINSENQSFWSTCLHHLQHELSDQPFGYAEVSHALLKLLIFDVLRQLKPQLKLDSSHSLVSKVIRYIERNYQYKISLSDVASAMERSSAYLTDLVRKETGKTVLEWILEYRMANARELLLFTSYSVSQIAERVGYFDSRHFSRQFLRSHKMTPKKWRNLYCNNENNNDRSSRHRSD